MAKTALSIGRRAIRLRGLLLSYSKLVTCCLVFIDRKEVANVLIDSLLNLTTGEEIGIEELVGYDSKTGQIAESVTLTTPEERKRRRDEMEKRLKRELRHWRGDKEPYTFVTVSHREGNIYLPKIQFDDLDMSTTARLLYLASYSGYDNVLKFDNNHPMKKCDLKRMLRTGNRTVDLFWKSVCPKYLFEDEYGQLLLSKDIFFRGMLSRSDWVLRQRMLLKSVRSLFDRTDGKMTKYLGYIFQMVPYINREWNVLCWNPLEENLDKVKYLSYKDFCQLVNYDFSHFKRLKDIYQTLLFDTKEGRQMFCVFNDKQGNRIETITVNPNVFYIGTEDDRHIEALKMLFVSSRR